MVKIPPPPTTGIHFIFMKKQSTCTSIRTLILMKDTKVKHLCREQTTISPKRSIRSSLLQQQLDSRNFSFYSKQTQSLHTFYIFTKVSRHGNLCLKVNKKFTNIVSSSHVLQDFWFLNGISALFTKATPEDSNEQNSFNIVRQQVWIKGVLAGK